MYLSQAEFQPFQTTEFTDVLRLAGKRELRQAPITRLFGLDIVRWSRQQTASELAAMARAGECATVHCINARCVNALHRDPEYREVLSSTDFVLPDGRGLAMAANLSGARMDEVLTCTELFPAICEQAAERNVPLFLLGGAPGFASVAASAMQQRYPDLMIAGVRNGCWSEAEEDDLLAEINRSGAGIVIVGMASPMQEKWIARVRHRLHAPVVMGAGDLFDRISGQAARASLSLIAAGFERALRLLSRPHRHVMRYLFANPMFLARATLDALHNRRIPRRMSLGIKRYFDMLAIVLCTPALVPIFLAIMLIIRMEDKGPAFFRQTRVGMDGKPFTMLKFRSMRVDAEAVLAQVRHQSDRDDVCFKLRDDPRVTKIGKVLRRFSLDELPQLINVVKGEMSLVGPRPALPREVAVYSDHDYGRLFGIPGITCSWQVEGRAEIPFDEQVVLDKAYLESRSFFGDIVLLLRTIPAVIIGRGAY